MCGIACAVQHPVDSGEYRDISHLLRGLGLGIDHRGQESTGAVTITIDGQMYTIRKMDRPRKVLTPKVLRSLPGYAGGVQTRYGTTGSSTLTNAQPLVAESRFGRLAILHNGNVIRLAKIRKKIRRAGMTFQTTSDTETILLNIVWHCRRAPNLDEALRLALSEIEGAFSIMLFSPDGVRVVRDPRGYRPLVGGDHDGIIYFASESLALDKVGIPCTINVKPGQMYKMLPGHAPECIQLLPAQQMSLCAMEGIYLQRGKSRLADIDSRSVETVRIACGRSLPNDSPLTVATKTVVVGVPDSGLAAANGYAIQTSFLLVRGIVKRRDFRSFIMPTQAMREEAVRKKYRALKGAVRGKNVIVVDDSNVRGTTLRALAKMLREAGALQIHARFAAPPLIKPCRYGINIPSKGELIAHRFRDLKKMAKWANVDSIGYLTKASLHDATGLSADQMCTECFPSDEPVELVQLVTA